MKQRTIKVFLRDGDPSSIRVAEIAMSTIQAIAFRRNQLPLVREEFPGIERPGVYILVGADEDEPDTQLAYIGESEEVGKRLTYHRSNRAAQESKSFWTDTVVLISKDENLTKSHARYVESCLIRSAEGNPRWSTGNAQTPLVGAGKLPLSDRAAMDEFVDQTKILVGTLGWDLFREVRRSAREEAPVEAAPAAEAASDIQGIQKFFFAGQGFKAEMHVGPSGDLIVKEGSTAKTQTTKSIPRGTAARRERLLKKGVLRQDGDSLVFTSDYIFRSPSAAASTVRGASMSGPASWKLADGRTYGEWESGEDAPVDTAPAAQAASDIQKFFFDGNGFRAELHVGPSGDLVVKAGSKAKLQAAKSIPRYTVVQREGLLKEGVLRQDSDSLVFTRDHIFRSPSAAAATIKGMSMNGPASWKLADGRTYGEWESGKEVPVEVAPAAKVASDIQKFFFDGDGFAAEMHVDPSGVLIVKAGSTARNRTSKSIPLATAVRRAGLLQRDVLRQDGNSLVFTRDYLFESPSTAAEIVRGESTDGDIAWKLPHPDGRTYREWESGVESFPASELPPGAVQSAVSEVYKFFFEGEGFAAEMHIGPSGDLVVKAGSTARMRTTRSIPRRTVARRERLLKRGVLRHDGDSLLFTSDYVFRSSSAAAGAVSGASMSGPASWKLADGRTYGEWESSEG